jgi:hypothetical protein
MQFPWLYVSPAIISADPIVPVLCISAYEVGDIQLLERVKPQFRHGKRMADLRNQPRERHGVDRNLVFEPIRTKAGKTHCDIREDFRIDEANGPGFLLVGATDDPTGRVNKHHETHETRMIGQLDFLLPGMRATP